MKTKFRRYILVFAVTVMMTVFPSRGVIYQNGNVSFLGTAVNQACIAKIHYQGPEYTFELDECPWSEADIICVIVSTSPDVGCIPLTSQDNTVMYSHRILSHYSLSLPGRISDSKEASVITVYYP